MVERQRRVENLKVNFANGSQFFHVRLSESELSNCRGHRSLCVICKWEKGKKKESNIYDYTFFASIHPLRSLSHSPSRSFLVLGSGSPLRPSEPKPDRLDNQNTSIFLHFEKHFSIFLFAPLAAVFDFFFPPLRAHSSQALSKRRQRRDSEEGGGRRRKTKNHILTLRLMIEPAFGNVLCFLPSPSSAHMKTEKRTRSPCWSVDEKQVVC